MRIREYMEKDVPEMISIWNNIVEEGIAFPQEDLLTESTGREFFEGQTFCGVAEESGNIAGLEDRCIQPL